MAGRRGRGAATPGGGLNDQPGDDVFRTAVVAIGGNALSPAAESAGVANQFRHARESLVPVVELARRGWSLAVVHGNGPQVGDELWRNERARGLLPEMPLGVLVASTAGWIGYMIQQSLQNAFEASGVRRRVVTLITQVRVDPADRRTREPRKFIGRPVEPRTAEALRRDGVTVEEDDEGRLRRRVPSPEPLEVIEGPVVAELVRAGAVVVAAGGGGIPVYRDTELGLEGVDAVVDKDLAAALLARAIGASLLLILTDVDAVYLDYGSPAARPIRRLTALEARALLAEGQLGRGSMEPKVRAGVEFVERCGGRAVIAALEDAWRAATGEAGTEIVQR